MSGKILFIDIDPVYGVVNYGTMDEDKNGGYVAKMRCRQCGHAWLDVNHVEGHFKCPKCGTDSKAHVFAVP